jgi:chemotaxis protein CheY-P-specific phosphatase CheC
MYLGTINKVDYYHINTGVEAKQTLREISENKVEFVTEEKFDKLIDQQHFKAEYIRYYNSMSMWLLLIISVVLLQSCSVSDRIQLLQQEEPTVLSNTKKQ